MGIMDLVVMKRMSTLPLYRRRTVQDNEHEKQRRWQFKPERKVANGIILSTGWREKKTATNGEKRQQEEDTVKKLAQAAEIATMGKTWKEEGKEHPSWAARQSQKAGIVPFTGKKITFD
jgi:BUD22